MSDTFSRFLDAQRRRLESTFNALAQKGENEAEGVPPELAEASSSIIANGGKRIRPMLVYMAARSVTTREADFALDHVACAIEIIHTYSLVHDDLPAMDDDDLRRGKPSLHKAYDEATAILVGDGRRHRPLSYWQPHRA
jgi:geranylgeranyl pyrophosphate synthase